MVFPLNAHFAHSHSSLWDQSQSHSACPWHAENGTVWADEGSGNHISWVWAWDKHPLLSETSSMETHCRGGTIPGTWFYASFHLLIMCAELWVSTFHKVHCPSLTSWKKHLLSNIGFVGWSAFKGSENFSGLASGFWGTVMTSNIPKYVSSMYVPPKWLCIYNANLTSIALSILHVLEAMFS